MFNIHDTEAKIVPLPNILAQKAEICRLSGEIGRTYLRLYSPLHNGYVGISFEAYLTQLSLSYHIDLCSTIEGQPLAKKDGIVFHFEDGTLINGAMVNGRYTIEGEARNSIMLDSTQVHQFLSCPLSHITILNKKTTNAVDCFLKPHGSNIHYQTKQQGQKLLKIALERVIGAAMVMTGAAEVRESRPEQKRIEPHTKLKVPHDPDRFTDDGTRRGHGN